MNCYLSVEACPLAPLLLLNVVAFKHIHQHCIVI